jgi:hypothetical protein
LIKSTKILLWISGILTLPISIYIVVGMRKGFSFMIPYVITLFFFFDFVPRFLYFLYFFILFMFTPVAAAIDFLCAYYIDKGKNMSHRIASYRSLITCLFSVFPISVGFLFFSPFPTVAKKIIIEGFFYFFFYGTICALLMIGERKTK